jgi:hypothetical protein
LFDVNTTLAALGTEATLASVLAKLDVALSTRATEATLASVKTAVETIDNFISGTRGLVTEDNSAAIKAAVETIDNFISGSRGLVTEDNSAAIKTAVEVIDNFISGSRGLVTEDNSASILAKLVPLAKASQHGVAETADTDILAADLSPTNTPCLFRTMVMLETSGVFSAILKNGGVNKTLKLNGGTALTASCAYVFDILVHSGDTVNFQTSVSGNVTLRVQEIVGGVQ